MQISIENAGLNYTAYVCVHVHVATKY